jgi:hypothetical protein
VKDKENSLDIMEEEMVKCAPPRMRDAVNTIASLRNSKRNEF